jgi:mono/diheme cytochrome c family protein
MRVSMSRFLVSSTVVALIAISGLAFMLIAIVIARSPYTHGNLSPQGYNRTEIAYVGEERPFEGPGLADPTLAETGDLAQDGRFLFIQNGCAQCHGLQGQGAIVGDDLDDASPSDIRKEVRDGPEGMPAFGADALSDEHLEKIIAFLTAPQEEASKDPERESGRSGSDQDHAGETGGGLLERLVALLTPN